MNKKLVMIFLVAVVPMTFCACGQTPFGAMGFSSESSNDSSGGGGYNQETNVSKNSYALLSAEQILKSMSSVTDVGINGPIMNEYNARNTVLATNNDLRQSTAPMMIAISNLAGTFCEETLNREVSSAASSRKLYPNVNFTSGIGAVTDAQYVDSLNKLGQSFWGRAPASAEVANLQAAKAEFNTALTAAERSQAASTRNLMLFTCTAMLASFDSFTF